MTHIDARQRLIVALDVESIDDARALVNELDGLVSFYKIGLWLQLVAGVNDFVHELIKSGNRVFIDYKHFDVPETMRRAVENAAAMGVSFLTVHGVGDIVAAAVEGRGTSDLKVLTVTVLTSLDAKDINDMGYECSVEELVLHRARKASEAGCDGIIASGHEARAIRKKIGADLLIVTPGIRPEEDTTDDHKRAMSPAEAIAAGADYLVVGRPIWKASDRREKATKIVEEMQRAFDDSVSESSHQAIRLVP